MEHRILEIEIISAKDLNDVNLIGKMDVYAVVSLSGDSSKQKTKTTIHRDGGTNPTWNFPVKFTVTESLAQQNRLTLVFKLKCERTLGGDKDIGEVNVPVKELLDSRIDSNKNNNSMQFVTYQVRKPSGKPKGALNFSFKFGEKQVSKQTNSDYHQPVTAYPAPVVGPSTGAYAGPSGLAGPYPPPPVPAAGYAYPPPPPQYGAYPPPPPAGYGYPPQPPPGYGYPAQGGYGYPPVQQQPPKKNKFGLGLGAGLLGGAVGGLLIGDMVSDAASYDAGYDAGFDDAGGFDF